MSQEEANNSAPNSSDEDVFEQNDVNHEDTKTLQGNEQYFTSDEEEQEANNASEDETKDEDMSETGKTAINENPEEENDDDEENKKKQQFPFPICILLPLHNLKSPNLYFLFFLARVKTIMKVDPEIKLISKEALILVTKAVVCHWILSFKDILLFLNSF